MGSSTFLRSETNGEDAQESHVDYPVKVDGFQHLEAIGSLPAGPSTAMQHVTPLMVALSCFIAIGGFVLNFDLGYTGLVLVMQPFNKAFGSCTVVNGVETCALPATGQSLASSIYLLFMALGGALSGVVVKYLGTRSTAQVGCLWIIVGAAGMLGCTGNLTAYIVCKCIGATGIGHIQTMTTTYGVECAPSRHRGKLTAVYSCGSGFGALIVSCVCLGTLEIKNDWCWKLPILLQIPVALIFGLGFFIFPESPRWLLSKDRVDEAAKSFGRLYKRDPASADVANQIRCVKLAIDIEKQMAAELNWVEIFHPKFVRRTLTSCSINICGALSGAFFIFTYAALFLESVGTFSNSIQVSVIINACLFAGLCFGPFLMDLIGRRWLILSGYMGMMSCMVIFAAVSSGLGSESDVVHDVLVVFLCLWAVFFGGCIGSSQWLTSAEMHAIRHRPRAQAFNISVTNVFVFATNFWTPYMLDAEYGNMGTNVGYFYFGTELVAFALLFFILPENALLTLEQIDEYFMSGRKPWKTSLRRNKRIARGEIGVGDD
jgi:sugar porter (SP) family MFS transporter